METGSVAGRAGPPTESVCLCVLCTASWLRPAAHTHTHTTRFCDQASSSFLYCVSFFFANRKPRRLSARFRRVRSSAVPAGVEQGVGFLRKVLSLSRKIAKLGKVFSCKVPTVASNVFCVYLLLNPIVHKVQKIKIRNLALNRLLIVEFVKKRRSVSVRD